MLGDGRPRALRALLSRALDIAVMAFSSGSEHQAPQPFGTKVVQLQSK